MPENRLRAGSFLHLLTLFSSVASAFPQTDATRQLQQFAPPVLWPIKATLHDNVSLEFNFTTEERIEDKRLWLFVYEGKRTQALYQRGMVISNTLLKVSVPCQVFSHPGAYKFKYQISGGAMQTLKRVMHIKWDRIVLSAPQNHTVLNGFVPVVVYHDRSCLPLHYQDEVQAFWLEKGKQPRLIASRAVRRTVRGRQKDSRKRLRVVFPCELFDFPGTYFFEYKSGYDNHTLAVSNVMNVFWGEYSLYSPYENIFPCSVTLPISFNLPYCNTANDFIEVYEQETDKFVTRESTLRGFTTLFLHCFYFQREVKGYCFKYVSVSKVSGVKTVKASICLPTTIQETHEMSGWSAWSQWGQCSTTCGKGRRYRYKMCHTPKQVRSCPGSDVEYELCTNSDCPVIVPPCECGCTLTDTEGMISSSPRLFAGREKNCVWLIHVPSNQRVKLWFDVLKLSGDWIIIRDGSNSSAPILSTLKYNRTPNPIISRGSQLYLKFHSAGEKENASRRGFSASYSAIERESDGASYGNKATEIVAFAGIFALTVVILATIFFLVYKKIQHSQKESNSPSSRSSCTSDTTVRSTQTDEPAIRQDVDIECDVSCSVAKCNDAGFYDFKKYVDRDLELQDLAFFEQPVSFIPHKHVRKQYKHKRKHKRKTPRTAKKRFEPYNNECRLSDDKFNPIKTECSKLEYKGTHGDRSFLEESPELSGDHMIIDPGISYTPGLFPYQLEQLPPLKTKTDHRSGHHRNDVTREKKRTREKKSIKNWERNIGPYAGLRQVVI